LSTVLTAYFLYSLLCSICEGCPFHPQPEFATCCGGKEPLNKYTQIIIIKYYINSDIILNQTTGNSLDHKGGIIRDLKSKSVIIKYLTISVCF
jgi:hypothetical protein